MKFTLEIELGNDAMRTPDDISQAIRVAADRVSAGYGTGIIYDINGNTVGKWQVSK